MDARWTGHVVRKAFLRGVVLTERWPARRGRSCVLIVVAGPETECGWKPDGDIEFERVYTVGRGPFVRRHLRHGSVARRLRTDSDDSVPKLSGASVYYVGGWSLRSARRRPEADARAASKRAP